jgi:thiopurine S-methyltransferase
MMARMERSFWLERWQKGEIGFHREAPNAHLVEDCDWLTKGTSARVLVPLCGKTVDMRYLDERGCSVVGVELAEKAAEDFFREQGLTASRTLDGSAIRYESGRTEILVGDFFEREPSELGTFDAIFDRAAMVALPPELRARYVAHLANFLAPGGRLLLVTFVYDGTMQGPPFSVPEADVRAAYEAIASVKLVRDLDIFADSPRFQERGATFIREQVWHIERTS